jgi:hypothetical protein
MSRLIEISRLLCSVVSVEVPPRLWQVELDFVADSKIVFRRLLLVNENPWPRFDTGLENKERKYPWMYLSSCRRAILHHHPFCSLQIFVLNRVVREEGVKTKELDETLSEDGFSHIAARRQKSRRGQFLFLFVLINIRGFEWKKMDEMEALGR